MNKNRIVSSQTFGEFFRQKRVALGFTLRSFCQRYNYDAGNISKLERNILSPSIDNQKLEGYALALKIQRDSAEWTIFFDLAHMAKGQIPKDILNHSEIMPYLPLFLRTVAGKRLSKAKIEKLIELINKS